MVCDGMRECPQKPCIWLKRLFFNWSWTLWGRSRRRNILTADIRTALVVLFLGEALRDFQAVGRERVLRPSASWRTGKSTSAIMGTDTYVYLYLCDSINPLAGKDCESKQRHAAKGNIGMLNTCRLASRANDHESRI